MNTVRTSEYQKSNQTQNWTKTETFFQTQFTSYFRLHSAVTVLARSWRGYLKNWASFNKGRSRMRTQWPDFTYIKSTWRTKSGTTLRRRRCEWCATTRWVPNCSSPTSSVSTTRSSAYWFSVTSRRRLTAPCWCPKGCTTTRKSSTSKSIATSLRGWAPTSLSLNEWVFFLLKFKFWYFNTTFFCSSFFFYAKYARSFFLLLLSFTPLLFGSFDSLLINMRNSILFIICFFNFGSFSIIST